MAPMKRPTLALIAAVARNGTIGKDNELLWRESEDQKHFRRVTMGHPVIMGRKTWESLPERFRPLPGRRNVIISRQPQWQAAGAEVAESLDAALEMLCAAPKAFVIGGAQIYALAMPLATELVLTEIDAELPGTAFFPEFDRQAFEVRSREAHITSNGVHYSFATYIKNQGD